MAKLAFTKLGLKPNSESTIIKKNDCNIEIKHYLSFEEKLEMISRIINQSIDGNGYYNPMRVELFTTLEIVFAYTNLSFTEKMKNEPLKLYDSLTSTGFYHEVIEAIGIDEYKSIQTYVEQTIHNIYEYRNSLMGIMDIITTDYSNLDLDAKKLTSALSNADNLALLKDILTKMG